MSSVRWFDSHQPRELQGAVLFSYLNAALSILSLLSGSSALSLVIIAGGVGAFGIANERRWGYYVCLIAALVFLVLQILLFFLVPFVFSVMLNLLFSVFLVALLLHPVSRSYQRLYFR